MRLLTNITGARIALKWQEHSLNEGPQVRKIYWNIFSPSVACLTFFLIEFQISKSKLSSSGNQGLYSTTVWRQACICWCETQSPWTLNKYWSKVEKGGVPGASVRNSAHGKCHEERGLAYAKAWSSLRKPSVPEHLTPKPESVLCSHLHLWLYGGALPHNHFSRRRSKRAAPRQ